MVVSKYFNGYADPFEGTVDEHSEITDFYHISYDDGDSEEMTEDDVETHFLSMPKPQRPPKATKPPKTLKLSKQPKSPKAHKPATPTMKRANSDSVISTSSLEAVAASSVSRRKSRPKVLSLNANAPELVRSSSFTGPSSSHQVREPLSVAIPVDTVEEEAEEEEDDDEDEEEEEEEDIAEEEEEEDDASVEAGAEEVNQLIGKPVERTVTKEGCGIDVVQGAVSSYFPATKMFRVMYFDGECCDLTYQEVFNSIPVDLRPVPSSGKRKRKPEETSSRAKKKSTSAPTASPKRPKTLDLHATSSNATKSAVQSKQSPTARSPSSGSQSPVTPVVREADMLAVDNVELNIVRKVLFIVVSTVNNAMMDSQLEVLSSAQLKVLMPGVTREALLESKIGKKVRNIERRGSFRDSTIPDLATWVIQKLKRDVGALKEPQEASKRVNGKSEGDKENRSRGSSSPRHQTSNLKRDDTNRDKAAKSVSNSRAQDVRSSNGKSAVTSNGSGSTLKRSNSVSHLLNLLNSRNGRDTTSVRRDRDIFGNLITPQSKRRLGTANNWKSRRSTVVLDQVTKRVTENAQEAEVLHTKKAEEDDWQPSKISFSEEDAVCPFDKEVEVSKLLVFRPSGSTKLPERPPVKPRTGPLRSILRVRLPPPVPQDYVPQTSEDNPVPPTVQSTSRPAIDPIVVPPSRPSLGNEDVVAESPVFNTSKLSNVVSPTEKRKRGYSPPPCIPASEQPPLDFTEEGEDEPGSGANTGDTSEALPDVPKEPEHVEPVSSSISALSPVVSEDDSSEEGDVSSSDSPKADLQSPANCSFGPKDSGTVSMESPVQQATTTSA
ncbi:unnamed protein product [Phytophthora lilii]|uniref:Unnamed protein product n=1 Tax=Phytophthora lilii TaxID=2077276 RepID=A0A9W6TQI7_9STRA|nr:unnamed protein product [Phytophthora lilii]